MWSNAALWDRIAIADGQTEERSLAMDEARFKAFYQRTSRPLWGYLYRLCGKPALADDLLQEAYCRFLQAELRDAELPQLKSYLYRIATNLLTDHYRRSKWESPLEEPAREAVSRDDLAGRTLRKADLQRALDQVSPRERIMLWMAYVEGSTHKEIASRLGLREKSIKVLLFRARQRMASVLKQMGVEKSSDFHSSADLARGES